MSGWLERLRSAREAGDPSVLIEHVPYASFLGLSVAIEDGELIATMRFSDHLIGDSGIPALHGGTLGALLESVAIFTLMWSREVERLPKTITLTVDYLRSGRARDTFASATIEKHGRRVANVRAMAWQEERDRPIASALLHFRV
ncbi:MAG TPA: PaaI family thioesterase [Sandaracinaceae bacterium]